MSTRSKTVLFSIITVGVSILFCFVLLEYGIAYFLYPETQEKFDKEFDSELGWRYKPGTYTVKPDNSFFEHGVHINDLGLRENSMPRTLGNRRTRIIVLGDSFTFARAVPREDIFTSRLENKLNERHQDRYEIINAGVEGYGTAQELLLMRRLTERGLVGNTYVLQLFTNDILDNLRIGYASLFMQTLQPGYVIDSRGNLELRHVPQQDNWKPRGSKSDRSLKTLKVLKMVTESYVQSRPGLVRFATDLGIPVAIPRMPALINAWYDEDVMKRGVPLMKELIRTIKLEVDKQQARLLVIIVPSPLMVYPETYGALLKRTFPSDPKVDEFLGDIARSQRFMQQMCRELDIPVLDLYPVLLSNNAKALYFPSEGHFTKEGHSIVAGALAEKLTSMGHH